MDHCEAVVSSPAMPYNQNLSLQFVGSVMALDSALSTGGNRARSRTHSSSENAAIVAAVSTLPLSSGQDIVGDVEANNAAIQSPAHYITTRSATGRLAKRPKRDPSPPLSPPRKIGTLLS